MARTSRVASALSVAALGLALAAFPTRAFALPGGGGGSDAAALEEKATALRAQASELRAKGSVEDADALEKKAAACVEKAAACRAEETKSAEVKARIHELKEQAEKAKAEGREDDARALIRQAEELWRSSQPKKSPGNWETELVEHAAALREKARALREHGSVEDAEHLEAKAERVDKALALRRESNELEKRGKEAASAGNESQAKELMEQSGRTWRQADEILGGGKKEPKGDPEIKALLRGSPDEARRRIEGLRIAARTLRDTGMPERAEQFEKQAAVAERELDGRKDEAGAADTAAVRDEMERLRRRLAELEEQLRQRETK